MEIETHARRAFRFLKDAPETTSTLERERCRSILSYFLGDVFVEIELDWRESAVFILVGETVDGQRPSGYYVDGAGRHVRWHLGAALKEGDYAEQARTLNVVTKKPGRRRMLEQLDTHSGSLRTALPDLPRLIQQLQTR